MSAADYVYALSGLLQESPESTSLVSIVKPAPGGGPQPSDNVVRYLNWKDAWQNAFQALSRKCGRRARGRAAGEATGALPFPAPPPPSPL